MKIIILRCIVQKFQTKFEYHTVTNKNESWIFYFNAPTIKTCWMHSNWIYHKCFFKRMLSISISSVKNIIRLWIWIYQTNGYNSAPSRISRMHAKVQSLFSVISVLHFLFNLFIHFYYHEKYYIDNLVFRDSFRWSRCNSNRFWTRYFAIAGTFQRNFSRPTDE